MIFSIVNINFAMVSRAVKKRADLSIPAWIMLFTCFSATVHSMGQCVGNERCSVQRISYSPGHVKDGDRFTTGRTNGACNSCVTQSNQANNGDARCWCQCSYGHTFWPDINRCREERPMLGCRVREGDSGVSEATTVENLKTMALQFRNDMNEWVDLNQNWGCTVRKQEYLENDGQWRNIKCVTEHTFSMNAAMTVRSNNQTSMQWSGSDNDEVLDGILVKLSISCSGGPMTLRRGSCLLFKINGTHTYDPRNSECEDEETTTDETAATTSMSTLWTSKHRTDESIVPGTDVTHNDSLARIDRYPTAAIAGGTAAAVIIFIVAGVALFILWRRKFRPRNVGKHKNQRVTMSSLQNGHPNSTEGTVDNEIYAGDNAGIVDNVIYEGGMGADGVFSNPGYADKTPQFKPRMDAPGAFVQPNPGATNKTPTPQRNIIIDEPQYAQIVDDQYADPQKVRDRKDKKNKKKPARDENYADLKGPHEKQPGANNSNSNHIYQGLNKGTDYQSLRGPRQHHQVKPSQVPKTPQDEHDYTSLTPGRSKPTAGTLPKEEADYTVLEGPESPGKETAAGPDYTTLDGPDSPGDETTSGPDYTVLDGPDSPGD